MPRHANNQSKLNVARAVCLLYINTSETKTTAVFDLWKQAGEIKKKMEQDFADLLTDAFSDTSLLSFPDGDLDFEPLNFEEDKQGSAHGRLPVLTEEEENTDEDEEKEKKELGCENASVSDHISLKTNFCLTEEDTQHIKAEEEGGEEEEGEEETESEVEETGGQTGFVYNHFSLETYDTRLTQKDEDNEDESEEEDEDSEEEDPGIENTRGWSVVGQHDEDSCGCDEEDIQKVVGTGQSLAQDVENCIVGTGQHEDHMVITARQQAEEHDDLSSDSGQEVMISSTSLHRGDDVYKVDLHVPQDADDQDQDEGDSCQEVLSSNPAALIEHLDGDQMKDFLGDYQQGAGPSVFDYTSDLCEYSTAGRKGERQPRSVRSAPPEPKVVGNIYSEREKTEEQDRYVERQGHEIEDVDERENANDAAAAMTLGVKGDQEFAHCAICKSDTNSGMARISASHLKLGSSSESGSVNSSDNSSDSTSEGSSDSTSEGSSEEKVETNEPINETHTMGSQYKDLHQRLNCQEDREAGEEDSSKQGVAKLLLPETISDVPMFTCHNEAEPSNMSLKKTSSSDCKKSMVLEAEQREDIQETWFDIEAGPGVSEDHLIGAQLKTAEGLESKVQSDISWNTGAENNSVVLETKYEASEITDSEEEGFADEEEDDEEGERDWEQEQVRIDAFYKFYGDIDEEGDVAARTDSIHSGRKIRVQFCMDPLPQAIQYTDSSDTDISTDEEMDLDSKDSLEEQSSPESLRETSPESLWKSPPENLRKSSPENLRKSPPENLRKCPPENQSKSPPENLSKSPPESLRKSSPENLSKSPPENLRKSPPESLRKSSPENLRKSPPENLRKSLPESQETLKAKDEPQDLSRMSQTHRKRNWCLTAMQIMFKMTVVILMGLAMYWWITDQLDLGW
ncbi:hypothetical protein DPEC_G00015700 [Dallia pectoralis]|uniref:Uncharacterized protein n=1 Tax=Dallia pectoralis TaxID=75939 RepID=A0ACC2HN65_DALPE|nr:hypothetical protein DPEC_G00015700 [Dallia pectoralis]